MPLFINGLINDNKPIQIFIQMSSSSEQEETVETEAAIAKIFKKLDVV